LKEAGGLLISRRLERVGGLATSIAEDVSLMVGGEIFWHPLVPRKNAMD